MTGSEGSGDSRTIFICSLKDLDCLRVSVCTSGRGGRYGLGTAEPSIEIMFDL